MSAMNIRRRLTALALSAAIAAQLTTIPQACAGSKPSVAVLPFRAQGAAAPAAAQAHAAFTMQLAGTHIFTVAPRTRVCQLPGDLSGCPNAECAARAGRSLGTGKVILGTLEKTGGKYQLIIRFIDVETSLVEFTRQMEFDQEPQAGEAARRLAAQRARSVPLTGSVRDVSPGRGFGTAVIDIGAKLQVAAGDEFTVYRPEDGGNDSPRCYAKAPGAVAGLMTVVSVSDYTAVCRVDNATTDLREGDLAVRAPDSRFEQRLGTSKRKWLWIGIGGTALAGGLVGLLASKSKATQNPAPPPEADLPDFPGPP